MLVLFDIDDTLVMHSTAERSAIAVLHAALNISSPLGTFADRWRLAADRHFQRYLARECSMEEQRRYRMREVIDDPLTDAEADDVFSRYLGACESAWSLYDDVLPCLDQLAPAHRLGVVSNGQTRQQRSKLERVGLLDRLDVVLISEDVGVAKPDAEIFLRACTAARELPANTIYVGDRYDADAEGSRRAGLLGVWLDRLGTASSSHQPPILTTLLDLPALLGPGKGLPS